MAVNTADLKSFAPAMRRQLLEAVGRKLDLLLNSQTPDTLSTYAKQIAELREQEGENRDQLLERVAYTWFNRLCALRYLDAKGWHPFGCKVLMQAAEGETQPELLKLMRAGSLPAELKTYTNEARLHGLLDGQIPPAISGADPQGEVYRELVLASCRSYHQLLPELFEGLDDASELLLPDDLLSEASIAGGFRTAISDEDCEDVEIIGWLYQFYISEKKDQVIGKVVKSEDIPAATQLFTPNWIVKYMVQNSLGAAWLATYPDSPVKGLMEFYIEPAEQTAEVQAQLAEITPESLDPEEITLIDPACGSGHILVEAYVLLKAIYLERGYRQRDIPELILTKNLYGLDICPRAAQLAALSLLMKGREDDRRLLERGIRLNVMALIDSKKLDANGVANTVKLSDHGLTLADLTELKRVFQHINVFGSLIQIPESLLTILPGLKVLSNATTSNIIVSESQITLSRLTRQAEILASKYDTVVANPPYMGARYYCPDLKKFLVDHFEDGKADLYAAFTLRNLSLVKELGHVAMITIPNWMFLSSFEEFRRIILQVAPIKSFVHNGRGVWGSDFGSCSYVLQSQTDAQTRGSFLRLFDVPGSVASNDELSHRFHVNKRFITSNAEFGQIPGSPVAYWVSGQVREAFRMLPRLDTFAKPSNGVQTGDNDRFLRYWTEIDFKHFRHTWVPYNKGGRFRKWYGNIEHVVFWESNGMEIKSQKNSCYRGEEYYFSPGLTWSDVTSGRLAARYLPEGCIFDAAGPSAFFEDSELLFATLCLLNTPEVNSWSKILNSTVHFQTGDFRNLVLAPGLVCKEITASVKSLISRTAEDWNSYERSWDFKFHPLLAFSSKPASTLEGNYNRWSALAKSAVGDIQKSEEENYSRFIEAYRLQEQLIPEVPIEHITLNVNPAYRYGGDLNESEQWDRFRRDNMAEFLSYATGCMMGRYSLDHPGLILADSRDSQAAQLAAYEDKVGKPLSKVQFKPDPDGIIPVLDGEWFDDDIVARTREFLAVTFPESSVTGNLRFIEESLGKDIRKYFCTEFYKDHLQTYKKRPIYWLVQSPKKGFACLIYLHRYTKDTLNQVLNNYFRPYLQKLEARLAQLGLDQLNDDLPTRERTAARKEAEKITKVLKECQAWEQDALLPLAQQRIELDLDDGVKVNYLKLQDVLAPIPGLAAKED